MGRAARDYQQAHRDHHHAQQQATARSVGWLERRRWAKTAQQAAKIEAFARDDWHRLVEPVADRLDRDITDTKAEINDLEGAHQLHNNWLAEHPDYVQRVTNAQRELLRIEDPDQARILDALDQARQQPPTPRRDLGIDQGGMGL